MFSCLGRCPNDACFFRWFPTFRSYRELLIKELERGRVDVATQEKWGTLGLTTLEKLDTFIEKCDAVIHARAGEAVPLVTFVRV